MTEYQIFEARVNAEAIATLTEQQDRVRATEASRKFENACLGSNQARKNETFNEWRYTLPSDHPARNMW